MRIEQKKMLVFLGSIIFLGIVITPVAGWQYGVSMTPNWSSYDSIEMPTSGLRWITPPSGETFSFWISSITSESYPVFAQNGFEYNGLPYYLSIAGGPNAIPPNSWGMFWTHQKYGIYWGDGVIPPSNWRNYHSIYFSIAVFPSTGGLAYMFTDVNVGVAIVVKISNTAWGYFSGNIGGIAEGHDWGGSYGDIYVYKSAIWAQKPGQRNAGSANAYDSGSPSAIKLKIYSANVVTTGFRNLYGAYHYSHNTRLWSGSWGTGEELFPPDP